MLSSGSTTLGLTTLILIGLAIWSALTGVVALISWIELNLRSAQPFQHPTHTCGLMLTIFLIGIAITALLIVVAVTILLAMIPFWTEKAMLFELVRRSLVVAVIVVGLRLLYYY